MKTLTGYFLQHYLFFFLVHLLMGGYSQFQVWSAYTAIFLNLIVLLILHSQSGLIFPRNFSIYLIFLFFFAVSILWSVNQAKSLGYFFLFVAGGSYWLVISNLIYKKLLKPGLLETTIISAGVYFGAIFIMQDMLEQRRIMPFGLAGYTSFSFNHHHIGDLWAPVLYLFFCKNFEGNNKPKIHYYLFILIGFVLLILSGSRSAFLSLIAGIIYFTNNYHFPLFNKKEFLIFTAVFLCAFILTASSKNILSARPYYLQALKGILDNPLGVGVGNFGYISKNSMPGFNPNNFSVTAHNIILEISVGIGIFGYFFLSWLIKSLFNVLQEKKGGYHQFKGMFVILTANFLFDFTYFIPTMLWIWFSCLGFSIPVRSKVRTLTSNRK